MRLNIYSKGFPMRKLDNFQGKAPKMGGNGFVYYEIWSDENDVLYVKMYENEINTEKPGTFSKYLVSISKYMNIRNSSRAIGEIEVYDMDSSKFKNVKDNNNGGFLKAVLSHLLPPTN